MIILNVVLVTWITLERVEYAMHEIYVSGELTHMLIGYEIDIFLNYQGA